MVGHPIVASVRAFVDAEVRPVAAELEHADRYPHALVGRMRELGLFGALVPAAYGGLGLDVTSYARVIEELCRGWMSLAGVINSHTMAALIVLQHGTDEQRSRFLPRFARGEARGGLCLTEPHAGSDVQAIRTTARRRDADYVVNGTKMFVTNGREGNVFALLAVTDAAAAPRHRGMSCFIVEKGHPGLRVAQSIGKLGYKGVDTAELVFEDVVVPVARRYRDTPLMIIGEGTNEIQRLVIARQLLARVGERGGATAATGGTEEERRLALAVRQVVDKELVPAVSEYDRADRWPEPMMAAVADLGILGALVGPDLGGLGVGLVATTMLLEELARGWTTVAGIVTTHLVASDALARFAAAEFRRALAAMTRGEPWAASALS